MSITSITIENFKGIRGPVRVELKPITLLFGPNSAGKSTIIQALHYAQEVFEHHNLNADRTFTGGDSVDLGGFRNIVHNHDTKLPIKLRFDFRFDVNNMDEFPYLDVGLTHEESESEHCLNFYWDMIENGLMPWLEVTISWSSFLEKPLITSYKTGFGEMLFAETTAREDGEKRALSFLDLKSPVFLTDKGDSIVHRYLGTVIRDAENNILELNLDRWHKSVLPQQPTVLFSDIHRRLDGIADIPIFKTLARFTALLSSLLLSPVEYLREELRKFRYIGPLRKVPVREYTPALTNSPVHWSDGLAAWDKMYKLDPSFINKVNDWLRNRLETGYSVKVKEYVELETDSSLMLAVKQGCNFDEGVDLQSLLALPVKRRVLIKDEAMNIELSPHDIGVGISQFIPVVVLALNFRQGILAIEQPELHIHPALQVALGDLFIEEIIPNSDNNINGGKIFLLETHSEHLMLRFLRRIRETGEGEAPENRSLTPTDLSICFIERGENGISCLPIRVDEQGDFIDRWPKGFFNERARELF